MSARARVAARTAALLGVALALSSPPGAHAAFELRDASPASLGAASLEETSGPLFTLEPDAGLRVAASRASLYETGDLAAQRLSAAGPLSRARVEVAWTQVSAPGARESALSIGVRERGDAPLALGALVERLALAIDGVPGIAGIAAGGCAVARVHARRATIELSAGADRALRSRGLDRLRVRSALTAALVIRAASSRVLYAERWESDGSTSPRFVVDLPIGGAMRVRLGRGGDPGQIGAAVAFRIGRVELTWGRLDLSTGGSITGVEMAWLRAGDRSGEARGIGGGDGR
jgi:hypothetical protein